MRGMREFRENAPPSLTQDGAEAVPEGSVPNAVDDAVEEAVDDTQPGEEEHRSRRNVDVDESSQGLGDHKRQPRNIKCTYYDEEYLRQEAFVFSTVAFARALRFEHHFGSFHLFGLLETRLEDVRVTEG